jgi:membrane-bound metal-dependent hydrolase YbcI (DUF457 family)
MKLLTHVIFGFAVSLWLFRVFGYSSIPIVPAVAIAVSAITNWIIDYLGHEGLVRNPLTHSLAGSILITFIVTGVFLLLGFDMMPWLMLVVWLNCLTHYLLDVITTEGVELFYPISHKRYHGSLRYDNVVANMSFNAAAVLVVALWYITL